MVRRDPETNPAAFLGARLRRARLAAGFSSQDALGAQIGFDRTVIAKAETGERPPTLDVLEAWCSACDLDLELFADLSKLARSADGPVPTWFEDWLEAEREARLLQIWQPLLIPGLVQTADYARALFLAEQTDISDEAIEALVLARLERQGILDQSDPPHVVIVLDEAVLHRMIGTPGVMHDALAHLTGMSQRPNIVVQVVPEGNGAHAGLGGAFDLASADGTPSTMRMEAIEDQTTERRALIYKATIAFNRVRGDALPREASRDLIRKAAEQWKTT